MKKGYVLAILIVVAIVILAGIWWMRQDESDNTSSTTSTPPTSSTNNGNENGQNENTNINEDLVVTYDGSGFSPATLTVSAGDTVTFRNENSTLVWPASDDHPVHDDLSGFDALEGLGEGEEYSFTFEETGEWGYHNHLNSAQTGRVIVE